MQFDVSEQEGYKSTPSENGIMHLIVVGSFLNVQLLEETAGKVMRRFVIPPRRRCALALGRSAGNRRSSRNVDGSPL